MVLDILLNAGWSLLPCLIISLIMMLLFLLCNCEHIGESLAHRCYAWRSNRVRKVDSVGTRSKKRLEKNDVNEPSTSGHSSHNSTKDVDVVTLRKTCQPCHSTSQNIASLRPADNRIEDLSTSTRLNSYQNFGESRDEVDNDPPPAYENCVKKKKATD